MFGLSQQSLKVAIPQLLFFLCSLIATLIFWSYHHGITTQWYGVPSVPSQQSTKIKFLGDQQLAYRSLSLSIQNFGDTGGRTEPLRNFDYNAVINWFYLGQSLDKKSNYLPNLAAYYYGGIEDKTKLRPLIDYLADIGQTGEGEKWRWLAQAVFLARFKLEDQDLALNLAYKLAALEGENLPVWTDQMPAFVLTKVGEEKAALDIMTTIMATDRSLQQNDINYMCWYIEDKINPARTLLEANEIYQNFCI